MKHLRWVCLILLLALTISASAQDRYKLEFIDCPFPIAPGEIRGQTIDCAWLVVPENHADPDSPDIVLAVAILYSHSDTPQPDPILYLEGGPGGSALSGVDSWYATPLRDQRDIILFDQRGTGYSQPYLGCLVDDSGVDDELELIRLCRDQLTLDGVNLAAYNSAASVADMAALRAALGVQAWNLLGISYGTRLALTAMRDDPQGIRSVILDSVYPPQVQAYEEQAPNMARALNTLFAACAASIDCDTAFPDLEAVFYDVLAGLNDEPLIMENEDPAAEFTGDDLFDAVVQALYDTQLIPYLPLAIYTMYEGDFDEGLGLLQGAALLAEPGYTPEEVFTWAELLALNQYFTRVQIEAAARLLGDDELSEAESERLIALFTDDELDLIDSLLEDAAGVEIDLSDSDGMNTSVECYEEIPFSSMERALAIIDELPAPLQDKFRRDVEIIYGTCDLWGAGVADPVENEPVVSDLPTLVLAGAFDPVTPPLWAEAAAAFLPNSYYYLFANAGHGIHDINECAQSIYDQFLADPATAPDGSCTAGLMVKFVIR